MCPATANTQRPRAPSDREHRATTNTQRPRAPSDRELSVRLCMCYPIQGFGHVNPRRFLNTGFEPFQSWVSLFPLPFNISSYFVIVCPSTLSSSHLNSESLVAVGLAAFCANCCGAPFYLHCFCSRFPGSDASQRFVEGTFWYVCCADQLQIAVVIVIVSLLVEGSSSSSSLILINPY